MVIRHTIIHMEQHTYGARKENVLLKVLERQIVNFSAILWREQVNERNNVCWILNTTDLLKEQSADILDISFSSDTVSWLIKPFQLKI